MPVAAGEAIAIETPGAGGYGRPRERDGARLAEDRASGKFSAAYLARHYPPPS